MAKKDWERKKELLWKAYTDIESPASYGSLERLYKQVKKLYSGLERGDVERFLLKQPTFTRNKPRRSHFPRRRTIKKGVFNQLSCDLMDLQSLKSKNKNYSFILVMLDIVSHFLVAIPLKTKSKQSMMDAFEFALNKTDIDSSKVKLVHSDEGKEFTSIKNFLKSQFDIKLIHTSSGQKAYYAERYIKELEKRLFRHLYVLGSSNWISILDKIVRGYNETPQRSLKNYAPKDFLNNEALSESLKKENALKLLAHYKKHDKPGPFLKGDKVRYVLKKKSQFDKAYIPSFSDAVETIVKVFYTIPNTYKISNHPRRKYYAEELSLVAPYRSKRRGEEAEEEEEEEGESEGKYKLIRTQLLPDRTTRSGKILNMKKEYLVKNLTQPNKAAQWLNEAEYKALEKKSWKASLII